MESLDGLATLHMSGARAVFTTEGNAAPDEKAIAAAFEGQGMKLERIDRLERPRAKAVFLVDAGIT